MGKSVREPKMWKKDIAPFKKSTRRAPVQSYLKPFYYYSIRNVFLQNKNIIDREKMNIVDL